MNIVLDELSYSFGLGETARRVLDGVSLSVGAGEIVLLTGPSGSGKTTLLGLIGGLRKVQGGKASILGTELKGASARQLVEHRRRLGFVFQAHNLVASLTAFQNICLALELCPGLGPIARRRRAREMLAKVGLAEHGHKRPRELSGGQRQRVAIARALASGPQILLADEPTAALDRDTGRQVVELIAELAHNEGASVVLVTHDDRILDVADRIVHLDDGKIGSYTTAVATSTRNVLSSLGRNVASGELSRRIAALPIERVQEELGGFTAELDSLLQVLKMSRDATFQGFLGEALEAMTGRVAEAAGANRCTLFFVEADGSLWSLQARHAEQPLRIELPAGKGIAGQVASSGEALVITDAYQNSHFDPSTDQRTGWRTRQVMCKPLLNASGEVFAVAQVLNRADDGPFTDDEQRVFGETIGALSTIAETWRALAGDLRD